MLRACLTNAIVGFIILIPGFVFSAENTAMQTSNELKPRILYVNIQKSNTSDSKALFTALASQFVTLGLSENINTLRFNKLKQSINGYHYYFDQYIDGIKVESANFIVSVDPKSQSIFRLFSTAVPKIRTMALNKSTLIDTQSAYDIAWANLGVQGQLIDAPSAELLWNKTAEGLRPVYQVRLAVSQPFGYWQYHVDAGSGKILKKEEYSLDRLPKGKQNAPEAHLPSIDRSAAFADFANRTKAEETEATASEGAVTVNGRSQVFDPDPRTTLMDQTLQDDSPASRFDAAYVWRDLQDIKKIGNRYLLQGPWVQIQDFESPYTKPTESETGVWEFKRGNNGFNDAMTYFHIAQNQMYIQKLGFTGSKGIQQKSIEADSDGLSGQDNSHFVPSSNRISFGHGCVDDNEDTDVILHEYGHAIEDDINPNWHGGDTGAMGEGFGDYWAASYSVSTPNGLSYFPSQIYSWDGHGQGDKCWSGRRLDALSAKYDPKRTYRAHQTVGNFQSDELWSTPLFQSLLDLMRQGYPRENVDRIILEAHFGLGANLTMRDMANAIVSTAARLYPNDPYAQVFKSHFVQHNILESPRPKLELEKFELLNAGPNGQLDPGEQVALKVWLKNTGNTTAHHILATLTPKDAQTIVGQASTAYMDIAPQENASALAPFDVALPLGIACGTQVDLVLKLTYEGETAFSEEFPISLQTGLPYPVSANMPHNPALSIPDGDSKGIESSVWLEDDGVLGKSSQLSVLVNISHSFVGDLKVSLIAPSGKSVALHNHEGGNAKDLIGTYPDTLEPSEKLTKLRGEKTKGEWKLQIIDSARSDQGALNSWELKMVTGFHCEVPQH